MRCSLWSWCLAYLSLTLLPYEAFSIPTLVLEDCVIFITEQMIVVDDDTGAEVYHCWAHRIGSGEDKAYIAFPFKRGDYKDKEQIRAYFSQEIIKQMKKQYEDRRYRDI